jgi:hypothetical protein
MVFSEKSFNESLMTRSLMQHAHFESSKKVNYSFLLNVKKCNISSSSVGEHCNFILDICECDDNWHLEFE